MRAGRHLLSAATATTFKILTELGPAPIVPNAGSLLAGRAPSRAFVDPLNQRRA